MKSIQNDNYNNNKIEIKDINKLIEFISNKNMVFEKINSEILDLFDITSYISLFLFQIYIKNPPKDKNYNKLKENNPEDFHDTLFSLYKLSLIFNEINSASTYLKKSILFSLFNIFYICSVSSIPAFNIYKDINFCILNKNSILFSESLKDTYLDIFSETNDFIYSSKLKNINTFDTNGNNLLISNDILYKIFMILLSKYINILSEKNLSNLIPPEDPFKPNYTIGSEKFYYENIYYLNILNYKVVKIDDPEKEKNEKVCIAADLFWKTMIEKCYSNIFNGFKTFYPFKYIKNDNTFSLYNYLIGFFFNQRSSPQFLIHFIEENNNQIHFNEISKEDICHNEIYILFNFIKIYFTGYNLNQYKEYLSFDKLDINSKNIEINYDELIEIFKCIKKNRPSMLVSMLFLRRLLPNILEIISERTGIETNIFFF